MPIVTAQQHLLSLLTDYPLPQDIGVLRTYIMPLNPNADAAADPQAFIWGGTGDEARLTVPRAEPGNLASGGDKQLIHQIDIYLVMFLADDDADNGTDGPAMVDAVMALLRNTALLDATQHAKDPITGQLSNLLNIGENMSYQQGTLRALADQRMLRFDALVTCEVIEIIQA